jgi:hypothetical protein
MVRQAAEATSTGASANAKTTKDADDGTSSSTAAAATALAACRPEHGFHAFDALYCALTRATPVKPLFPNDK